MLSLKEYRRQSGLRSLIFKRLLRTSRNFPALAKSSRYQTSTSGCNPHHKHASDLFYTHLTCISTKGMFNWFKKVCSLLISDVLLLMNELQKEPEDYEEVLSSLALDIQKRQQQLSDIRLREKRTTLLVTIYTFAAWTAYVAVWYSGFLPQFSRGGLERAAKVFPVFLGPIL